jgi:hypothetical protein
MCGATALTSLLPPRQFMGISCWPNTPSPSMKLMSPTFAHFISRPCLPSISFLLMSRLTLLLMRGTSMNALLVMGHWSRSSQYTDRDRTPS